jgi:hypothetical protein
MMKYRAVLKCLTWFSYTVGSIKVFGHQFYAHIFGAKTAFQGSVEFARCDRENHYCNTEKISCLSSFIGK